jgi:hypothetical protein
MTSLPLDLYEYFDDFDAFGDGDASDAEDWPDAMTGAVEGLRLALDDEYADASDEDIEGALADVLDQMTPAEAFNFTSALNQIGRTAGRIAADPTFGAIAKTALPIAGGAVGTLIGGPVGTALGTQLGSIAAGAIPTPGAAAPRSRAAATAPLPAAPMPAAPMPAAPAPVPTMQPQPLAGGSPAAAQALVLSQHPQVLQGLLATALGQYGQQQVGGIPVAQLLGTLSQVFGQAAADADELMYGGGEGADAEGLVDEPESPQEFYESLLGADNLELSEVLIGSDLQ